LEVSIIVAVVILFVGRNIVWAAVLLILVMFYPVVDII
jgi:hypothetical protein